MQKNRPALWNRILTLPSEGFENPRAVHMVMLSPPIIEPTGSSAGSQKLSRSRQINLQSHSYIVRIQHVNTAAPSTYKSTMRYLPPRFPFISSHTQEEL